MTLIFILIIVLIIPSCLAESWTVTVYTGKKKFAGTDSNVYIRLYNSQDESTSEYQLTHYNWMPEKDDFPLRNLFEMGAREQFRIRTEDIKSVAKIQIRHDNFPPFQADWLLDQVVVERNRDGAKYTFKCNCWLRGERPYITLSSLPDQHSIDKNKTNNSFSKNNRNFVIILLVLISLVISIFCCYNEYRRRQRFPSLSFNDTSEQIQQEPSLLNACHLQTPRSPSPSPSSAPQLWINTVRRWKNLSHGLPSYSHTRTTQTPAAAAPITPADEPPAYEDLYPNSTASINSPLNSNS